MRAVLLFLILYCCCVFEASAKECIYDPWGECLQPCPPNTISYSPGCGTETLSRRTCRAPVARVIGRYCDYSRCDCDEAKVWDEAAQTCVKLEECSNQSKLDKETVPK